MAEPDGTLLVAHPDLKARRVLQRILGVAGRSIAVVDGCAAAEAVLDAAVPAVIVIASSVRLLPGCDALVARARAGGAAGIVVVHDGRGDVSPALFDAGTLCHLVTSTMPVLAEELFVTVQKLLRHELFGLEKYLAWGAVVGETEIVSTDDRLRALGDLGTLCERMQIGRRQEAAVLLAADELIQNAVHHAPVDDAGVHFLRDLPRDAVRKLVGRERPRLRFGCDGRWFAVAVRDAYGSADAPTLVRYVAKSLIRRGQVRIEGPGAGIGLAMTFTAVTQLVFDVDPGRATEAIALVDVRPWSPTALPPVASFHVFFGEST
jgi:hypothetical protein